MPSKLPQHSTSAGRWRRGVIVAALALAVACAPVPALAHVPSLEPSSEGSATPIGGPEVSRAIYGYLAPGESIDAYTFTVPEQLSRTIGIIVPAYPELAEFRPALVVESDGKSQRIVDPGAEPRQGEWEPFSLTTFWKGAEADVAFTPGARYTLRVEPGDGASSGRYVIVFGGPEQFSGSDTAALARQLPTIWFGAYGGAPFRWNWSAALLLAVALGVLALLAFTVRRRRGL